MSIAKHFGAVADGVVDDTKALQHAINDGDGMLELSRGTYRITAPLVLDTTQHGYLSIRGAQGTARIVMDGPGPAIKVLGNHQGTAQPDTVKDHTWDGERFPTLSGFEILGGHPEADGIQLFRTMQATVRNVLVRHCRHGIHLAERDRNVIIADCHIYDCSDSGIFMDHVNLHQINILGNHISYCKRAGIRQLNGDVHNVQITGNDIEYNSGFEGLSGEIVLETTDSGMASEYTIASNTIQATPNAMGANIVIVGQEVEPQISIGSIAITGNILGSRDKNLLAVNSARAISVAGNVIYSGVAANVHLQRCRNVTIGSNSILPLSKMSYNKAGLCGIVLEDCWGCAIVGNTINEHDQGDSQRGGAVTLLRCTDTSVSSCQILSPKHRGVYLEDCERCRVSDNTVTDSREEPSMSAAIEVRGASKNNLVQNNLVGQGANGAILCEDNTAFTPNNTVLKS